MKFKQIAFFAIFPLAFFIAFGVSKYYVSTLPPNNEYYLSYNGHPIVQCNIPIYYGFSRRVPIRSQVAFHDAADYWNEVYGGTLFIYEDAGNWIGGKGLIKGRVYLDFILKNNDRISLAYTKRNNNGHCIYAYITIFGGANRKATDEALVSIFRHELGHALGLEHRGSSVPDDLMFEYLNVKSEKIKCLSVGEINAFKRMYRIK